MLDVAFGRVVPVFIAIGIGTADGGLTRCDEGSYVLVSVVIHDNGTVGDGGIGGVAYKAGMELGVRRWMLGVGK